MHISALIAVLFYIALLVLIGFFSYHKNQSSNDFIIGSRKMNFWLTALAAHASDMSSWIFMAYPAVLFTGGLYNAWLAIGLTACMLLCWQIVAPRLRVLTEKYNSLTLSSFFESRFSDTSGLIRVFTVLIGLVFYTIYISALLVALGILLDSLFSLPYILGITIGICVIIPYLFIGGYVTLAYTDLFQGIFLLIVIVTVPLTILPMVGGFEGISHAISLKQNFESFLPANTLKDWISTIFLFAGWGLGYLGMPHVITKFMGIKNPKDIPKSKWVGISWQILSLCGATLIGLVGIAFFASHGLKNPEHLFINMVMETFPAFLGAFILCAIFGATITAMDSMILVLASNLTEDLYKKMLRKNASSRELLIVSRVSILIVALIAFLIAATTSKSIFSLVSYAWFGLGASFGPLVLFALYSKRANRYGAWGGLITGGCIAGSWPLINRMMSFEIPTLVPAFCISSFTIWAVSSITQYKNDKGVVGTIK